MSTEVTLQDLHIPEPSVEINKCPNCGFEHPEGLIVCWKCGARLDN